MIKRAECLTETNLGAARWTDMPPVEEREVDWGKGDTLTCAEGRPDASSAFAVLGRKLSARVTDAHRLSLLEASVEILRLELGDLAARQPVNVVIETLAPEPYRLLRPITVALAPCDGGFIATFFDAEIGTQGETEFEAVCNLKEVITGTFEALSELPQAQLGPVPSRQLAVLQEVMTGEE